MAKITRQELLKIAQISRLYVQENEIEPLIAQIQDVLTYSECVRDVAVDADVPSNKNVNVFEADVVKHTDPSPFLAQAPDQIENFFVVPKILEDNE
jgi:aspartyl/glutamyl-tRNA(Asn/Gln) amidotransferase C subunit